MSHMDLRDLAWGLRRGRRGGPGWVPAAESMDGEGTT